MNAQERYHEYLKSDYWKEVAYQVKKRAGFKCQLCNSQLDLVAHHRCYDHRGDELNHLDDLVCICQRCHGTFHGKEPAKVAAPIPAPTLHMGLTKAQRKAMRREARDAARKAQGLRVPEAKPAKKQVRMAEVEARIPPGDPIILTKAHLIDMKTELGGYTYKTVTALGLEWKNLIAGWTWRLVGTPITRANFKEAIIGSYNRKRFEVIP